LNFDARISPTGFDCDARVVHFVSLFVEARFHVVFFFLGLNTIRLHPPAYRSTQQNSASFSFSVSRAPLDRETHVRTTRISHGAPSGQSAPASIGATANINRIVFRGVPQGHGIRANQSIS
jgi:hypothetical protein